MFGDCKDPIILSTGNLSLRLIFWDRAPRQANIHTAIDHAEGSIQPEANLPEKPEIVAQDRYAPARAARAQHVAELRV